MKRYDHIGQFVEQFGRDATGLAQELKNSAALEIRKRMGAYMRAIAPVGGALTRDRDPGRLKRSFRDIGSRPGEGVVRTGSESSVAPHATIIDRGRKRGVTAKGTARATSHKRGKVNKAAKMMGSKQAPQGMTRPSWKRVQAEREAIVAKAIRAAEVKAK